MDSWEKHHIITLVVAGLMTVGVVYLGYLSYEAHNITALAAAVPSYFAGLTGLHAGSSYVAASPNTPPFPPQPPAPISPPPLQH